MNFNSSTSALTTWATSDRLSGSCERASHSTTKQLQGVSKESTVPSWMLFRHLSQPPHTEGVRLEILVEIRSLPERDWGGTGGNGKRAGEVVTARGQPRGEREEWRRRRESGGESGGRSNGGHSGSSKVAGETRRETRFSQSWLGVGFFKYSRGNCGVFREAL